MNPPQPWLPEVWVSRLKIGLIAAAIGGGASFGQTVWGKVDLLNTANAQNSAKADAAVATADRVERRLEGIDSGTRADIQRLERKIDANNETTEKKLAEILRAVKSK